MLVSVETFSSLRYVLSKVNIIAVLLVLLCLIAPMFIIQEMTQETETVGSAATATVALGTIIRSNGRNILKSTFMSAIRTGLRAVTRRLIRTMLPMLLRLFLPTMRTSTVRNMEDIDADFPQPLFLALGLGIISLTLSFYGVVVWHPILEVSDFAMGLSLITVSILAGLNIAIHYGIMAWAGIKYDVKTSLRTSLDGMILQAYFTGALSFLPLASDVELKGETAAKAKVSTMALLVLLGLSLVLDTLGILLGMVLLEIWAAQLLLYTFVISFPLQPLEGSDIFAESRLRWFGVFLLIMLAFLLNMPETFYAIL